MYITDPIKHAAIARGMSELFKPIRAEFIDQYPSEIDFYKNHLWFITLTFNQTKITLEDRVGLSTGPCRYQKMIDERVGGFVGLNSKNISELRHLAKKIQIQKFENLDMLDLKLAIADRMGIAPLLQRPLVAVRPKPTPLKVFGRLHEDIAKQCLGPNFKRKLKYQPRALAHVDFEGTRNGASVDPLTSTWIHIHASLLVRPEHADKFNKYRTALEEHFQVKKWQREIGTLNKIWRQKGLTAEQQDRRLDLHKWVRASSMMDLQGDLAALHDIEIEPYNPANPLAELMGYTSKGAHLSTR